MKKPKRFALVVVLTDDVEGRSIADLHHHVSAAMETITDVTLESSAIEELVAVVKPE